MSETKNAKENKRTAGGSVNKEYTDDTAGRTKRAADRDAEMFAMLESLSGLKSAVGSVAKKFGKINGARRRLRAPRTKLPRCPTCGAYAFIYHEMWAGHSIQFVANDGVPDPEGTLHDGDPVHVEAECGCGKRWRLKGISQITDLEGLEP